MCVLFSAVRARSLQVGDDAVIPWFDNYVTSCHCRSNHRLQFLCFLDFGAHW
jgi:hypothetical protein